MLTPTNRRRDSVDGAAGAGSSREQDTGRRTQKRRQVQWRGASANGIVGVTNAPHVVSFIDKTAVCSQNKGVPTLGTTYIAPLPAAAAASLAHT